MAVLIMIFAALLGATFVTVVALNINQTARSEDRTVAAQNARAGLRFINDQLTNSAAGERWRPTDINSPPLPGDPTYNTYYTPFDQAQGWARKGTPGERIYAKFPDPRSENVSDRSPTYLVAVDKLGNSTASPAENPYNDKTGALRISVIGLANNNPAVFSRLVADKPGLGQTPLTANARGVTNWNFANNTVPVAEVAASVTSSTTLTVNNVKAPFPTGNFYIVVGDPITNNGVRGFGVESYTASTSTTGTLTLATSITAIAGERVEMAAGLGAPRGIDFDNSGGNPATTEYVDFKLSDDNVGSPTPGGVRVNGGLLWFGNILATNLRSVQAQLTNTFPASIQSSGLMAKMVPSYGSATADTRISGTYKDASGSLNSVSGAVLAADSSSTAFPAPTAAPGAWGTMTSYEKDQMVSDSWNRLLGSPDPERQVQPFTPPDITAGGNGVGRYRQMSKYSESTIAASPTGGAYGWGKGTYFNNVEDREKVYDGTLGRLREMKQDELRQMWFATTSTNAYYRKGTPLAKSNAAASLEEQHLRGWIGPDEFQAPGVLVELNDDGTITYTKDSRDDGTTYNQGVAPNKAWRDADGNLMGNATLGGVYQQTLPWPANGVIFAEGNIRIRGTATAPPRSLTVVSMNNIYVEDSLSAGTRKILLLAKKNVVLNPTRVMYRPDYQTLLRSSTTVGATSLDVYDASAFKAGDWIYIDSGSSNDPAVCVASVPNSNTINLVASTPITTARAAGLPVKTQGDPVNSSGVPYNNYANRLERFNQTLQRRFMLPAGSTAARIALRHSAERKDALAITANQATDLLSPQLTSALLSNKLVPAADPQTTIIKSSDKVLKVDYVDTANLLGASHTFPSTLPTSEALAIAYRVGEVTDSDPASTTDDLQEELANKQSAPNWSYTATVSNNYNANTSPLAIPPFFFLASVGNRADIDPTTAPGTYPYRKNIFTTAPAYTIPMATSVIASMNGSTALIRSDRPNTSLGTASGFEEVTQFGFSSLHGAGAAAADQYKTWEDVLTASQGFYRNGYGPLPGSGTTDNTYYTLDSRTLSGATAGVNNLAFRLNPAVENYFDATSPPTPLPSIPYYRMSRVKLENASPVNGDYLYPLNSNGLYENLAAGYTIDVNATVYAQEGSWFVIPGGYFDEQVKSNYVNLLSSSGTYNSSQDAGENLDLDRDGVITRAEKAAVYRFYRYNYKINFTGSIMENQTAIVRNTGNLNGAVQEWMDKWATVNIRNTDWSSPTDANATLNTLSYNTDPTISNFGTITYKFDDTAARDLVDADIANPEDVGFRPPQTPELLYLG